MFRENDYLIIAQLFLTMLQNACLQHSIISGFKVWLTSKCWDIRMYGINLFVPTSRTAQEIQFCATFSTWVIVNGSKMPLLIGLVYV